VEQKLLDIGIGDAFVSLKPLAISESADTVTARQSRDAGPLSRQIFAGPDV